MITDVELTIIVSTLLDKLLPEMKKGISKIIQQDVLELIDKRLEQLNYWYLRTENHNTRF